MKIHDHVCTFDQAKTLRRLGVDPQLTGDEFTCAFRWKVYANNKVFLVFGWNSNVEYMETMPDPKDILFSLPAFTASELGLMLPIAKWSTNSCASLGFRVGYCDTKGAEHVSDMFFHSTHEDTEAKSRAAMLIHLLESGETTADEVNKRLNA